MLLTKECTGFVANRLAFALLREALLVSEGAAPVENIGIIMQNSMRPRWAVAGPSKSSHAGGYKGGLETFYGNEGKRCRDVGMTRERLMEWMVGKGKTFARPGRLTLLLIRGSKIRGGNRVGCCWDSERSR